MLDDFGLLVSLSLLQIHLRCLHPREQISRCWRCRHCHSVRDLPQLWQGYGLQGMNNLVIWNISEGHRYGPYG